MMYGYGEGFYCSDGFFGLNLYMIIPFVICIAVIYLIYKFVSKNNNSNDNQALVTLNNKYINGEISKEDYLSKKKVLKK